MICRLGRWQPNCSARGSGTKGVSALGLPEKTVERWLYTYRALGKEALFVTTHKKYSHELKVAAARDVVENGMTRPDVMAKYGIASLSAARELVPRLPGRRARRAAAQAQGQAAQAGKTRIRQPRGGAGGARARVGAGAGNPKTNKRLGGRDRAEIASSLRREWPLALVLEKLGLKRSTFYYHLSHPRRDRYADVRPLVREAFSRTANGMGYRQVALALRNEQGLCISGKTVLRLMREEGLRCRIRRRRYSSYRGDQGKAARNVLDRDFSSDAPMRKLVTDITEFHQPWGKAYLSPVMDLYNNEIVAWSVGAP